MDNYDVIIIGAGHAGIEAALASSRLGCKSLLVTLRKDTIGLMSCNPAIGGVGKAQLVREIDALGGQMALGADACGIQFRTLNASKGLAAQSLRAQIDMDLYKNYMQGVLAKQENLSIQEAQVKKLIIEANRVKGIITDKNEELYASCVVICPGTFLDGLIHVGLKHQSGGRLNEPASIGLADDLRQLGFGLLSFKTGTCMRLDKKTIDFKRLKIQEGDNPPQAFSFSTLSLNQRQVPCYITYTNSLTHKIITDNLDRSPLYSGLIKAIGVRYCPSVEDKVVKFSQRARHQIFLEPQGLNSGEIYPNGLSTSLPEDVQEKIIQSIDGLQDAKITRFGYGIEHAVVEPTQLFPTLETKGIGNLFLAGQINGTTGYEEAAAQGLIAGINASLRVKNRSLLILDRAAGYIGVLLDDLTTKGTAEPYRMFTSRVEYRLILRQDNADIRLRKIGFEAGLLKKESYLKTEEKIRAINEGKKLLKTNRIKPSAEINALLLRVGTAKANKSFTPADLLKRPQVSICALQEAGLVSRDIPRGILQQIEIEVKYAGFIERQFAEVERFKNLEKIKLPLGLDYAGISGLSREIKEKLVKFKPFNLGVASRISGVTPVAISILMVYLKKYHND